MLDFKFLFIALAMTIVSGGTVMTNAAENPGAEPTHYLSTSHCIAKQTPQDFVPDGDLKKPAWRHAAWFKMGHDAFKRVAHPESATEVASLWTPGYVYFAYRCKYQELNVFEGKDSSKDFWTLWTRDVVEVFLNPQPEPMRHYYEFEVAPNNLWIDLEIDLDKSPVTNMEWSSGWDHATHIDAEHHVWTCEMRIPLASMQVAKPLEAGTEWRVNFFRADGPGEDAHRRFLSWSPVSSAKHSFHSPWSFGVIRFER